MGSAEITSGPALARSLNTNGPRDTLIGPTVLVWRVIPAVTHPDGPVSRVTVYPGIPSTRSTYRRHSKRCCANYHGDRTPRVYARTPPIALVYAAPYYRYGNYRPAVTRVCAHPGTPKSHSIPRRRTVGTPIYRFINRSIIRLPGGLRFDLLSVRT